MTSDLSVVPKENRWASLKALVLDSVTSRHSRRAYSKALDDLNAWRRVSGCHQLNKATVQRYRAALEEQALAPSSINVRLSAIKKLANEAADNGLLLPEVAAAIGRVPGAKRYGTRTGNWLSLAQAEKLLSLPEVKTNRGKRDRALLSLLLGCGLRREELAFLSLNHIQQREGRPVLVDLVGKGRASASARSPCRHGPGSRFDEWIAAAGITEGRLLRPVNKSDRIVGDSMTSQSIFERVAQYGQQIGVALGGEDRKWNFKHAK